MASNDLTPEPIVETKLGKVQGRVATTIRDFPFYSFQGMRYAQPPVGNLRFKAPRPATPWTGIWNAKKEGNRSVSFNSDLEIIGDEDCLFINVYTPELPNDTSVLLPVMFWIHGGGYYLGSGNTDLHSPDYLIDQGVVIVTFNYRLGALGYMTFQDPKIQAPGNAAFKDMIMALRWVKDNIMAFNGDPNNVTVWGQSAGGIAAHLMCVSPMAKDLFHKAIIQSGTGFVGFATPALLTRIPLGFASHAGREFNEDEEYKAYEYLLSLSKEEIVRALIKVLDWSKTHHESIIGPMIEHYECGEERFLSQEPELYYLQKRINAVPVIIGCNSMDGMVYATKEHVDGYMPPAFDDPRLMVPVELGIPKESDKCLEIGQKIQEYYYGDETPSRRSLDKYIKYQTDVKYTMRIKRMVQLHQYATTCPVYVYRFGFESPLNLYKRLFQMNLPGVCHGDELTYIWHTKYPVRIRPGSIEDRTQHRLITFWTNFAKSSNPNPVETDTIVNTIWQQATKGKVNHVHIGKQLSLKDDTPDLVRMAFWDEIYLGHFKELFLKEFGYEIDLELLKNIVVQVKLLKWTFLGDKEKKIG